MSPALKQFRDYTFGYASAETETARDPRLLIEGFLDPGSFVAEILQGDKFLLIGNKGSGKSAIAHHLKLSANYKTFVTSRYLSDFPYSDLKTFIEGDRSDLAFPTAWSWLLLVTLLGSFLQDQGSNIGIDSRLVGIVEAFRASGLLQASDLKELLFATSQKRHLRVELPLGFRVEGEAETDHSHRFPFFVEQLRTAMLSFRTSSRHLLMLDGLDDVLNVSPIQYESLASLVLESLRINEFFRESGVNAKIVLLCPTDLFERLPGRNTNKIRQEYSLCLDWYTPDAENSLLWQLSNLRASLQSDEQVDIRKEHLPPYLQASPGVRVLPRSPAETGEFLLRYTRYTPRDFVMLLISIQKHAEGRIVEPREIGFALQEYAVKYFIHEIRDELAGYFSPTNIEALFTVFGKKRSALFSFNKLVWLARNHLDPETVRNMLNTMFNCSAIGNWERNLNPSLRTFRYKFRDCRLSENEPIVLHPALSLALNVGDREETLEKDALLAAQKASDNTAPEAPLIGEITRLRSDDGLIRSLDGETYHFYFINVRNPEETRLVEGDTVVFRKDRSKKGMYPGATKVRLAPEAQRKLLKAPAIVGKIDALKGSYGFIKAEDGRKFFFPLRNLVDPDAKLVRGSKVKFRASPFSSGQYGTATWIELIQGQPGTKGRGRRR